MTAPDISAWTSLTLGDEIAEGNRNQVWKGSIDSELVAIRRSRRAPESLDWELDLITHLDSCGFWVPTVITSSDGRRHVDGIIAQRWLEGRPPQSDEDWLHVAVTLQQLHQDTADFPQRPGCKAVSELTNTSTSVDAEMSQLPTEVADEVLAVFASVTHLPRSVIHGDPLDANIRIDEQGRVGLLDFDESRVDVAWHDLSNLGCQVLDDETHAKALRLSDAWETANAWVAEPEYALERLRALRTAQSPTSAGEL